MNKQQSTVPDAMLFMLKADDVTHGGSDGLGRFTPEARFSGTRGEIAIQ